MNELLEEIKSLPNIVGSFVYIDSLGAKYTDLPRLFRNEGLDRTGRAVDRIFSLNETAELSVESFEIKFEESVIFVKQIDKGSSVFTICDPGANIALVNMTTKMLSAELKKSIDAAKSGKPIPAETSKQPLPQKREIQNDISKESLPDTGDILSQEDLPEISNLDEHLDAVEMADGSQEEEVNAPGESFATGNGRETGPQIPLDIDTLINDSTFSGIFEKFQNALIKAIGPIGGIIMRDTVEKWIENGSCDHSRLGELADMLCVEIDNNRLEKEFRDDIKSLVR